MESNLIIINPSKLELSSEANIIPKWRVINRTIKRLEDLSKKAYDEDINIGFEFLGSIPTLNDAMEVLEPIESQENLGYIINTRFISDSDYNQLKKIKDFIFLIKLSGLKYDEEDITDISKDFIKFTQKIGYRKVYSIELSEEECLDNLYKKFNMKFENI
ncbi:MAG: hypothetical protein EU540_04975 [Promethearchaeota archaeon]|nr:MAG: hypothetical protein EU540_04975 [Candidatus Lokiarchaeota archaeon]